MYAKKLLTILFLGIFLISLSSAITLSDPSTWDDKVTFHEEGKNGKYGYYEINDTDFWFFNNKPVKTIELIENDYSVFKAWNIKEIEIFKPTKLFDKTNYMDIEQRYDRKNLLSSETHLYREWKTKTMIMGDGYCGEYGISINGTEGCSEWVDTSYEEEYEEWGEWQIYSFQTVKPGLYQTKTIVTRDNQDTGVIDWVDENEGHDLDEWATWWDNDWNRKKAVEIEEVFGVTLTNYSKLINVSYDSDMKTDFSDIRFLDTTETTELSYWIDNKTDSVNAWVWVKVPTLTASSNTTIYMYYKNSGASSDSSFNNAFLYGNDGTVDDFTDNLIGTCTATLDGGRVKSVAGSAASCGITLDTVQTTGKFEIKYTGQMTAGAGVGGLSLADQTLGTYNFFIYNNVFIGTAADNYQSYTNGGTSNWGSYNLNEIDNVTVTVDLDILSTSAGTTVDNGGETNSGGAVADFTDIGRIRTQQGDTTLYMDDIRFRQIARTEPIYSFGEEEDNGAEINLISPEDALQTTETFQTFRCNSSFDSDIANLTLVFNETEVFTNSTVGTFIDLTHSENITTDGIYNWRCKAVTVAEQITQSENRTLTIHTTTPGVIIHDPQPIINYHLLGNDLLLNWTITEGTENLTEHVKNCTYEYNEVITVLNNTVCTQINQTNFTYILGVNNLTFNVTDEFDLVNSTFVEWDFTLLEISQTFDNQTFEGSQEIFIAIIEVDESSTLSQAIFNYNGTNYTTSIVFSGGTFLITSSITIPSVDVTTNFSFTFFPIINGQTFSLQTLEQEVLNINLSQCGIGDNLLLNMSLFDEETKVGIFGDIEINAQASSKTSGEISAEVNLTLENITSGAICLSPSEAFENLYLDTEIRYVSTDRVPEFYHIQMADMDNYPKNLSLFDLSQNDSTEFLVTYKNNNFIFTEDAVIQLQRKYIGEDIYEIVEAPLTGNGGGAVLHIDLNTNKYRASVVKDGELLDFFDNIVFSCENELSGDCTHSLDGTVNPNNDIPIETITDFSYSVSVDEDNQEITVLFAVSSGTPSTINVLLKQIDMFGNSSSCNTTVITSAGSITCDYTDTIEKSILELTISKDDVQLAIKSYVNDPDLDMDGMNFFIAFLFMISLVGMAIASPEWMILISVMVLIISGTMLLLQGMSLVMGLGAIAWVVIAAAIIIMKMSKQEDR